ncbi:hypothetical protein ACIBSW_30580 [Actinoplanes sp. NPDC049668]|uniref:hypothetical protein n=1 Tax=unclassified Actinoplanes TaxID=2626549 RepID=UPI0033AC5416
MTRRMASRNVALTAAFLALAAGGAAACDSGYSDDSDYDDGPTYTSSSEYEGSAYDNAGPSGDDDYVEESGDGEPADEVFYCADGVGEIVDEEYCADNDWGPTYFFWHSPDYTRGLAPGEQLDGGDYFPASDTAARRAFKLPSAGKVSNGTVKTNVVGRGSTGSGLNSSSGG